MPLSSVASTDRGGVARAPSSATAVREAIAALSPIDDGWINDLDRLDEDLGLGPLERLRLGRLLEPRLGHPIAARLLLRSQTVADLMTALR